MRALLDIKRVAKINQKAVDCQKRKQSDRIRFFECSEYFQPFSSSSVLSSDCPRHRKTRCSVTFCFCHELDEAVSATINGYLVDSQELNSRDSLLVQIFGPNENF